MTITVKEGADDLVIINIPVGIDLSLYDASIQVRPNAGLALIKEFKTPDTLTITGQQIVWNIPANSFTGHSGRLKSQLKLTGENTVKIFPADDFIVIPSINI